MPLADSIFTKFIRLTFCLDLQFVFRLTNNLEQAVSLISVTNFDTCHYCLLVDPTLSNSTEMMSDLTLVFKHSSYDRLEADVYFPKKLHFSC